MALALALAPVLIRLRIWSGNTACGAPVVRCACGEMGVSRMSITVLILGRLRACLETMNFSAYTELENLFRLVRGSG